MSLNIEISRPFSLLLIIGAAAAALMYFMNEAVPDASLLDAKGGEQSLLRQGFGGQAPQLAIHTAEDEMRRARLEQELTDRHIEVLKYQLDRLEEERTIMQPDLSPEQNEQYRSGLRTLVELIQGKRRADQKMVESFQQMWDARRAGIAAASLSDTDPTIIVEWPVYPNYGISAIFDDPEYEKFFGMKHNAVDIPTLQGTDILAADDGTVEEVVDNGLGYSYITIRHNGYVTLYGHVSDMYVTKGQKLLQGAPIGKTGGMPGTQGAGNLSTGPHLHFELITGAGHINPLLYLPAAGVQLRRSAS